LSLELWSLLLASLLGLVHLAAASFTFKAQVGNRYTVGPRDEGLQPVGMAGRLLRAQQNFMETYPIFAACILIAHLTSAHGSLSTWGAVTYLTGRAVFCLFTRWVCPGSGH
jgi:uncharacterized MAPEG superfamily protein